MTTYNGLQDFAERGCSVSSDTGAWYRAQEIAEEQALSLTPVDRIREDIWEDVEAELKGGVDPKEEWFMDQLLMRQDLQHAAFRLALYRNEPTDPKLGLVDLIHPDYGQDCHDDRDRDLVTAGILEIVEEEVERRVREWQETHI